MKKITAALFLSGATILSFSSSSVSASSTTVVAQQAPLIQQKQNTHAAANANNTAAAATSAASAPTTPNAEAAAPSPEKLNSINLLNQVVIKAKQRLEDDKKDTYRAEKFLEDSKQNFSATLIEGILSHEVRVPRLSASSKESIVSLFQEIKQHNTLISKAFKDLEGMRNNLVSMSESRRLLENNVQILRTRLQNVSTDDKITADILPITDLSEIQAKLVVLEANVKALQDQKARIEKNKTEQEMALKRLSLSVEQMRLKAKKDISQPGISDEITSLHEAEESLKSLQDNIAEMTVQIESLDSILSNNLANVALLGNMKADLEQAKVHHIETLTGNVQQESKKMKVKVAELQKQLLKKEEEILVLQNKIHDLSAKVSILVIKRDQMVDKVLSLAIGIDNALLANPSSAKIGSATAIPSPSTTPLIKAPQPKAATPAPSAPTQKFSAETKTSAAPQPIKPATVPPATTQPKLTSTSVQSSMAVSATAPQAPPVQTPASPEPGENPQTESFVQTNTQQPNNNKATSDFPQQGNVSSPQAEASQSQNSAKQSAPPAYPNQSPNQQFSNNADFQQGG